jgi:hypothetical protein
VVSFFGLVDAADAVVGPGKFHADRTGAGAGWRALGVGCGGDMMAMGAGAGKREALGSRLIGKTTSGKPD